MFLSLFLRKAEGLVALLPGMPNGLAVATHHRSRFPFLPFSSKKRETTKPRLSLTCLRPGTERSAGGSASDLCRSRFGGFARRPRSPEGASLRVTPGVTGGVVVWTSWKGVSNKNCRCCWIVFGEFSQHFLPFWRTVRVFRHKTKRVGSPERLDLSNTSEPWVFLPRLEAFGMSRCLGVFAPVAALLRAGPRWCEAFVKRGAALEEVLRRLGLEDLLEAIRVGLKHLCTIGGFISQESTCAIIVG